MNELVTIFGRLHPLILHAPLGVAGALGLLELWSAIRGRELGSRRELAVFAGLTALLAAASGWLLAAADGRTGLLVFRHRWAGVTVAVLLCATALAARPTRTRAYALCLALALAAAGAAGHWGATLTHGPGYLSLTPAPSPSATVGSGDAGGSNGGAALSAYEAEIAPFFARHCAKCHGPSKQKARLALHTPEGLAAGSFNGPVIVPGDPSASELLRRLRVPLEHEDHMPPLDEPQPDAAGIARIEAWIQAGAELPAPARFP